MTTMRSRNSGCCAHTLGLPNTQSCAPSLACQVVQDSVTPNSKSTAMLFSHYVGNRHAMAADVGNVYRAVDQRFEYSPGQSSWSIGTPSMHGHHGILVCDCLVCALKLRQGSVV